MVTWLADRVPTVLLELLNVLGRCVALEPLQQELLDRVADGVRENLHMDARQLPLAKVLEGGTWAAGGRIAGERRPGGPPPLTIASDGTVF